MRGPGIAGRGHQDVPKTPGQTGVQSTAADRLDVQAIALQARIGIVIALEHGEVDSSALEPVRET